MVPVGVGIVAIVGIDVFVLVAACCPAVSTVAKDGPIWHLNRGRGGYLTDPHLVSGGA